MTMRNSPRLLKLEKACVQQWRPSAGKKKKKKRHLYLDALKTPQIQPKHWISPPQTQCSLSHYISCSSNQNVSHSWQLSTPQHQGSITHQVLIFYLWNPSLIYPLFFVSTVNAIVQITITSPGLLQYPPLPGLATSSLTQLQSILHTTSKVIFSKGNLIMSFSYLKSFGG